MLLLRKIEGTVVFKTTDISPPNINDGPSNHTPNDKIIYATSRMSSVEILEATDSTNF
jgi:hypothetical protein